MIMEPRFPYIAQNRIALGKNIRFGNFFEG
jgi:hypothetical protein